MERSGHAFIKHTMIAHDGLFGCEASGHYFFRELGGGDDGLFAALWMTDLLRRSGHSLATLRKTLPPLFVTPDLRLPASVIQYSELVGRLRNMFPGSRETTVDGIRFETSGGFILVRESVTEPLATLRLEGRCKDSLDRLVEICLKSIPEAAEEISKQIDQAREQGLSTTSAAQESTG